MEDSDLNPQDQIDESSSEINEETGIKKKGKETINNNLDNSIPSDNQEQIDPNIKINESKAEKNNSLFNRFLENGFAARFAYF